MTITIAATTATAMTTMTLATISGLGSNIVIVIKWSGSNFTLSVISSVHLINLNYYIRKRVKNIIRYKTSYDYALYIIKWNVLYENGSCGFYFIT